MKHCHRKREINLNALTYLLSLYHLTPRNNVWLWKTISFRAEIRCFYLLSEEQSRTHDAIIWISSQSKMINVVLFFPFDLVRLIFFFVVHTSDSGFLACNGTKRNKIFNYTKRPFSVFGAVRCVCFVREFQPGNRLKCFNSSYLSWIIKRRTNDVRLATSKAVVNAQHHISSHILKCSFNYKLVYSVILSSFFSFHFSFTQWTRDCMLRFTETNPQTHIS